MKKFICFAAVLAALCLTCLPACQLEKQTDEKYFTFTSATSESGVEGYLVSASDLEMPKAVIIPATHNDLPVIGVAAHGFSGDNCSTIFDVVFRGDNVEIGEYAFEGLYNLRSVELRTTEAKLASLTIGKYAFNDCHDLDELTFKKKVGSISVASYAFTGTAFTELSLVADSVSLGDYALAGVASLESVNISNLADIGSRAFYGDLNLASIEAKGAYVSNGGNLYTADGNTLVQYAPAAPAAEFTVDCAEIGHEAFYGAANLKTVTLSQNVAKIAGYVFSSSSVESVVCLCDLNAVEVSEYWLNGSDAVVA